MIIRSADRSDLDGLADLECGGIAGPWSVVQLQDELNRSDSLMLVAECGRICGYLVLRLMVPEAELLRLIVRPECRRQGVARRLLSSACEYALTKGVQTCFLEVRSSNTAARHLYSDRGFVVCGGRPKYYSRPVEDALLMKKDFAICRRKDENDPRH